MVLGFPCWQLCPPREPTWVRGCTLEQDMGRYSDQNAIKSHTVPDLLIRNAQIAGTTCRCEHVQSSPSQPATTATTLIAAVTTTSTEITVIGIAWGGTHRGRRCSECSARVHPLAPPERLLCCYPPLS